ncbi:glr4336 [Gloeobacter violaceus PCC 7421]|uniref:Glr4336 protein n=2 Tax=Gloeobacter violaceus TaxID=33072 RepID=Q7NDA0_GLOVI|nr:glr4336 [Gloeobacter violaceus PCC 7421]
MSVHPSGIYTNVSAESVFETWTIRLQANTLKPLITDLLELASRIGGLGPGWRRPPHPMNSFNGYRGSQFSVQPSTPELGLHALIDRLHEQIRQLAHEYQLSLKPTTQHDLGSFVSIWRGEANQWWDLVHGVCSSNAEGRPAWCGDSQHRPSGYSVRQHADHSLITVFDPDKSIKNTLQELEFKRIWPTV